MKVSELIKHLELLDPEQIILVQGYEGGLVDITADKIDEQQVILNYHQGMTWYGPHEIGDKDDLAFNRDFLDKKDLVLINAYIIRRS